MMKPVYLIKQVKDCLTRIIDIVRDFVHSNGPNSNYSNSTIDLQYFISERKHIVKHL